MKIYVAILEVSGEEIMIARDTLAVDTSAKRARQAGEKGVENWRKLMEKYNENYTLETWVEVWEKGRISEF